ncbi:hypothetical protein OH77DRAFT_556699 [Trametes cingulata]|nr:hypothetical protein OH77DRAFT_556699 [Trametes cingulata]
MPPLCTTVGAYARCVLSCPAGYCTPEAWTLLVNVSRPRRNVKKTCMCRNFPSRRRAAASPQSVEPPWDHLCCS